MDTITLQEALAGFTANESAALGSYIGLSSGGAGQKQSIAALAKVAGGQVEDIPENEDLNNYTTEGFYRISSGAVAATISNNPFPSGGSVLEVKPGINSTAKSQFLYPNISTSSGGSTPAYYYCRYLKGTPSGWTKIEGTVV